MRPPIAHILAFLALSLSVASSHAAGTMPLPSALASRPAMVKEYGQLPLQFERNVGQTDSRVKFLTRSGGSTLFLTGIDAVLCLTKPVGSARPFDPRNPLSFDPHDHMGMGGDPKAMMEARLHPQQKKMMESVVRMNAVGSNLNAAVVGLDELPGKVNYFIGNKPSKWHTNIATYRKVEYRDLYRNIDLAYYGANGRLEYDFIVRPGGDPGKIALSFTGAKSMTVAACGDLVLTTACGDVTWRKPVVYQQRGGVRTAVAGSYVALGGGKVRFAVARYDASLPLVIDPVLVYSTYLGGVSNYGSAVQSISVNKDGSLIAAGTTSAPNFPVTTGAFQTSFLGVENAFISKVDPSGSELDYSTYVGGYGDDTAYSVAQDSSGYAYVVGVTDSGNFPITNSAYQTVLKGVFNAFILKLNTNGSSLIYSTYIGGSGVDEAEAIRADDSGATYVAGYTTSADFPVTAGAYQVHSKNNEYFHAFIMKVNQSGTGLIYSTFIGGSYDDYALSIAVDASGDAYAAGTTYSSDFPVTSGAFKSSLTGVSNAFVLKLNAQGSDLVYSTYLGGSFVDGGDCVGIDDTGAAYVAGYTESSDFPTTVGAYHSSLSYQDVFASKVNPSGSALVYSSVIGGSGEYNQPFGEVVDAFGAVYLCGKTNSVDFPVTANAYQPTIAGDNDAFIIKLNPEGTGLRYSSYFGGSDSDYASCIAIDASGSAFVAGVTASVNFPTTLGSVQPSLNGSTDAFISKLSLARPHNLLWSHSPDNEFSLWQLTGTMPTFQSFGPFAGWKAVAVASGADGVAHVLIEHAADHQFSVWAVNPDFTYTYEAYGPFAGWQATDVTVTPDNHVRLLLNHTADGQFSLWDLTSPTSYTYKAYGPYAGWAATHVAEDPNGDVRVLLDHASDHQASVWDVSSPTAFTAPAYGPYPGWQATGLAVGSDEHVHLLWNHPADGEASVWDMSSPTSYTSPAYGPYSGWTAQGVSVTDDGDVHVQWAKADGTLSLWDMASSSSFTTPVFGPYAGWGCVGSGDR